MKTRAYSSPTLARILQHIDTELDAGFRPTVAFVFQSSVHGSDALAPLLRERGMTVIGTTSAGEILGGETYEESFTVMAFELAPDAFHAYLAADEATTMDEKAQALGRFATESFVTPVVLAFASGLTTDGDSVVKGVHAGASGEVTLFGGLAGDDMKMQETRVFTDQGGSSNGLVGLVLDGSRYSARGFTTSGWQPVGVAKTITHAEANVVHTIDGLPALEVYEQYFDLSGSPNDQRNVLMDLGVQYPLSVERENGDTVIRAPLTSVDGTASLVFAGSVPVGSRVKFCIPPSLDTIENVVEEAAAVHEQMPEADALLLISCAARKTAFGPMIVDEVQGLSELWDAPLAGFFSYGEIGPSASGECDFHNETCTMVALSEVAA